MHYTFRKCLVISAAITVGISSCDGVSKPQAVAMNNMMVQINDSLFYMGKEFGSIVSAAVNSRDFSKLTPSRQRFENFIDSNRNRLERMKDVDGSGPLRKAEIDLLDVEKHMVTNDFIPFEKLTSFTTFPEISGLFDKIKADSKAESDKMSNFKREQKMFAKRNGFKLAANAPEK